MHNLLPFQRWTLFLLFYLSATCSYSQSLGTFFSDADAFMDTYVENNNVKYDKLINNATLNSLIQKIEKIDLEKIDEKSKKAFLINAYNLLVIKQAAEMYPIESVQTINGFFDRKKVNIGGEQITLNQLEKNYLLKPYQDPRLHFVLVCGAKGCPPITKFAYLPDQLEKQLDEQTTRALNDDNFIIVNRKKVELSQIFKWYSRDFGGKNKALISYINTYRLEPILEKSKITYYPYDWTLNDTNIQLDNTQGLSRGSNSARYIVSSTIPKGTSEVKIFNNLYSQQTGNGDVLTDRSTFFTTSLSYLYGLNNRLNIGIASRYRRVRNANLPDSPFAVFGSAPSQSTRSGLTALGPQIRYAPVLHWPNFSIQSSFVFAIGNQLSGSNSQPYIDWDGPTWWTQMFNDFAIGQHFSLFTEFDLLLEDIGRSSSGRANRFSTPVTAILSYSYNRKWVMYALAGYSPYWQRDFNYFYQLGLGTKYQFTANLEFELLFTDFSNSFLAESGGNASTYNVGVRFNIPH